MREEERREREERKSRRKPTSFTGSPISRAEIASTVTFAWYRPHEWRYWASERGSRDGIFVEFPIDPLRPPISRNPR